VRGGELALLAAALAAPLLPPPWSLLLLIALGFAWMRQRPRREVVVVALALAATAAALVLAALSRLAAPAPAPGGAAAEAREYARLWDALRRQAAMAAGALVEQPGSPLAALDPPGPQPTAAELHHATRIAFERLDRLAPASGSAGRRALLLIDPGGNSVAWGGQGLIHEPAAEQWPRSGLSYRAGFNAVTLLAAEPIDRASRGWRVVAGASFATDRLPRAPLWGEGAGWPAGLDDLLARLDLAARRALAGLAPRVPLRWSLADNSAQLHPGTVEVPMRGAPLLVVETLPAGPPGKPDFLRRAAWAALALVLLALAVMRGVGAALPEVSTISGPRERRAWIVALALGGVLALGRLLDLPPMPLGALLAGLAVAALGLTVRRRAGPAGAAGVRLTACAGAFGVLVLLAAARLLQRLWGPLDVAEDLIAGSFDWSLRLAWSGAAFGLFSLAGRRPVPGREPPARDRWAWLALVALLAAAALADFAWIAAPLLAAGGAAAALYADRQERRQGSGFAALVVLSALAAAGCWESAYRSRLAVYAGSELLDRLAPPSRAEVAAVRRRLDAYFARVDVESLTPRSATGLERSDFAYALWRRSPLARPFALSAMAVGTGPLPFSTFSFGMPLTREGRLDSGRLNELPGWEGSGIEGSVEIRQGGRPWGTAHYWLLPRPGFHAAEARRLANIEVELLRGAPATSATEDLAAPALFALYAAPDGHAVLSPWEQRPPLPRALRSPHRELAAVVETPAGPARIYVRPVSGATAGSAGSTAPAASAAPPRPGEAAAAPPARPAGWEAVYLPDEDAPVALERAGNWVVGQLLVLALAAPLAMLLALPRASFRELLRRTVRSYSKRLLIVYTVLLLLPLLLLNLVLVRSVEQRLESDQSTTGEAALRAAQQLLGSAIRALPPGFVFDPATFDPEVTSISLVVQHEVNLYWRSGLAASSKHELFTAGLLPKRIPGEIYSSLELAGLNLGALVNHAGDAAYLELYAPLRVPGEDLGREPQLFLSVPLLAQQQESARQLRHLGRHGILVTVALFLLVAAVGTRLARNFTRPLMQLVEGTRRIAAGATSLDLAPTELELAALVRAVDDMARRIAEGRERLVREKQVVERIVQNVTSGIVSLDRERRVLMHNRVAAELLGVVVGQSLHDVVRRSPRLVPVADFLRSAGGEMARATVRLGMAGEEEREWSLVWVPLPGMGEPFALLVVEDATEELRGQRLFAWAQMARMIAHEIKNPLTPIRLSAEHMREVHRSDPAHFSQVFEQCTANILTQVEELRSIASDFSTYSAIPRIHPQPGDLTAAVAELVEGYRAAPPRGVAIEFAAPEGPITARFDAKLLMRAVRNLLENALRASAGGGRVLVRVTRQGETVRIAVADTGPGVRPDLLPRIFDPYFSTHDSGTGLGLPIARRIAEEHGGGITAHNLPGGGLEAVITLPA
jgi:signal transduction histidine kinase